MKKSSIVALAGFSALFTAKSSFGVLSTIGQIYAGGAGSYTLAGTVTSVINTAATTTNFTIQDSTGSVLAYHILKTSYTPTVGDSVSFTTANSPYQGAPELTATGFTLVGTATAGTAPAPAVLSIPAFNASGNGSVALVPYSESIVSLDNVYFTAAPATLTTNTTYIINDGSGNSANFYGYASDSAVAAAITTADASNLGGFSGAYNISGYVDEYYGVSEIYPLSITAVGVVPEPATLGILAAGSLMLLGRRSRRA